MAKMIKAYRYDKFKFYLGEDMIQEGLVPPDDTLIAPTLKTGYWAQWTGKKWTNVKIPTTCAEAIEDNLTCVANAPDRHSQEVKAVLTALVAAESDAYRLVTDSATRVMSIEEIPEKTVEEVRAEKAAELKSITSAFENNENSDMYFTSSLGYKMNGDRRSKDNLTDKITYFDIQEVNGETVIEVDGVKKVIYTAYDNVDYFFTKDEFTLMRAELVTNGENLYTLKKKYRNAIAAATTVEELNAIVLDFPMLDFTANSEA